LETISAAYREFEDRVGAISSQKGNKSLRVEKAVENPIHNVDEFSDIIHCSPWNIFTMN
jgi:hypothetical protein